MSGPDLPRGSFRHVLGFDCSGSACSAALAVDGQIVAERFVALERGHGEVLLPQIQAVMREAGLAFSALDAIATLVGPGSFTGLRIGLAAARGLALAADRPILTLTAFEAVLAGIDPGLRAGIGVAVLIDSRRGPVFGQYFSALMPEIMAPEILTPEIPDGPPAAYELTEIEAWLPAGPILLAGDGVAALVQQGLRRSDLVPSPASPLIRARDFVRAAAARGSEPGNILPASPLYLRPPDVTQPKARPNT